MPILNFKKEFADLVASGKKRQTIRATRKQPIKVGDRLYLYTGLRTKESKNLLTAAFQRKITFDKYVAIYPDGSAEHCYVICKEVCDVEIRPGIEYNSEPMFYLNKVYLNDYVNTTVREKMAIADGFKNFNEMLDWFKKVHGLPFKGQLIKW